MLAVTAAVLAPVLAPADPTNINLSERLNPPFWHADGSTSNPLGTDHLGRDVLSRLLFGARITLIVGFVTVLIASTFGLIMGVFAGYGGGRADSVIMRIVDIELSFPFMALAVAIVAVVGPGVKKHYSCLVYWGLGDRCKAGSWRGSQPQRKRICSRCALTRCVKISHHAKSHIAECRVPGHRHG